MADSWSHQRLRVGRIDGEGRGPGRRNGRSGGAAGSDMSRYGGRGITTAAASGARAPIFEDSAASESRVGGGPDGLEPLAPHLGQLLGPAGAQEIPAPLEQEEHEDGLGLRQEDILNLVAVVVELLLE